MARENRTFWAYFHFCVENASGRLRDYVARTAGGAERILYFGSKITETINIHVSFDYANPIAASAYDLTLAPTADDGLFPSREVIHLGPYPQSLKSLSDWQSGREAGIGNPDAEPEFLLKGLRQDLALWQVYHLHDTSYIHKTAKINDNRFLRANASNLPAFLYFLRNRWADD
jgi:predicted ATPase